jgi:N-alpha-acetyltransferase 35, NatC auxiliary subunit
MGHPLSQTVFTSLYIDNLLSSKPDGLEGYQTNRKASITLQALEAYCLGLVKTCCHVNNRVKSEHFYEVK